MRPTTLLWRNYFLSTALWNLRMHSLQGHETTTQDRAFWMQILLLSVISLKWFTYLHMPRHCVLLLHKGTLFKAKRICHWRVNGKCLSGILLMGRNGNESCILYTTSLDAGLMWIYCKYFCVRKTGDHNSMEQCSRQKNLALNSVRKDQQVTEGWRGGGGTPVVLRLNGRSKNCSWCEVLSPLYGLTLDVQSHLKSISRCPQVTFDAGTFVNMTISLMEGLHDDWLMVKLIGT